MLVRFNLRCASAWKYLGDIFEANLFQRLALPADPVQELPDAHLVVMKSAWRKTPFMPLKIKKGPEPRGIGNFRS